MFALAGIIIGLGTPLLDAWQAEQGGDAPRGGTNPSWPFVLTAIALFVLQYAASGALEQPLLDVTLLGGLPALDCLLAATAIALWAAFDGTRQGLFMACLTAVCGPAVEITLINVFHLYACELLRLSWQTSCTLCALPWSRGCCCSSLQLGLHTGPEPHWRTVSGRSLSGHPCLDTPDSHLLCCRHPHRYPPPMARRAPLDPLGLLCWKSGRGQPGPARQQHAAVSTALRVFTM